MVYDFIEPWRIYVEHTVFMIFSRKLFLNHHVCPIKGGLSLDTEGKKLLIQKFNQFFKKSKISYQGKKMARSKILNREAQLLANRLKELGQTNGQPFISEEEE